MARDARGSRAAAMKPARSDDDGGADRVGKNHERAQLWAPGRGAREREPRKCTLDRVGHGAGSPSRMTIVGCAAE